MADAAPPVVYVESNWVVGCAVPHDDLHEAATDLLNDARQGRCELRVPEAAILESRHSTKNALDRVSEAVVDLRNTLGKAFPRGSPSWGAVDRALSAALDDPQTAYLQQNPKTTWRQVVDDAVVNRIQDPTGEVQVMEDLRQDEDLLLRGKDALDFYILAAMLNDRQKIGEKDRPVIVFSSDKQLQETPLKGAGLKAGFYKKHRMVGRRDFKLTTAVKLWGDEFG